MPKQYKVTPGFLEEMPRMEKPESYDIYEWQEYSKQLNECQRIPIAENVSFEGEIINEDQFEVREAKVFRLENGKIGCAECCNGDCDCEVGERCTYRGNRRGCTFCKGECWYESAEQIPKYAYPKQPEGKEKGVVEVICTNCGEPYQKHESRPTTICGSCKLDNYIKDGESLKQPQPTQEEVGRDERDMWAQVCGALAAYNSNGMGISEKIDRLKSQFTIQKRNTNG